MREKEEEEEEEEERATLFSATCADCEEFARGFVLGGGGGRD